MALWKKILIGVAVFFVLLAGAFVVFIGPWPTYTASFEGTGYFNNDMARIDKAVQQCKITDNPGQLKVGWGTAIITPPIGTPLAGYSARMSKPSGRTRCDLCQGGCVQRRRGHRRGRRG
ncbi:MAG: hypothetical protein NTU83_07805 [Candidatus Hydrogenedentes bacterium]|nr:hypothetical protein [Candidatus Hydrogenedentota bacterium]